MRRSRGAARARARLALALAACVACILARGVAGDAPGADVAPEPSGWCEAAAGRELLAAAGDGATAAAPESCDARVRDARRARGTDAPPGATDEPRADAEARDREGDASDAPKEGEARTRPKGKGAPPRVRTEFLRDRYIVRFSEYKMIGAHRAALERVLGRPSNAHELDPKLYGTFPDDVEAERAPKEDAREPVQWAFVERANRASALPTDFAVVAFSPPDDADRAKDEDVTTRFPDARSEKKRAVRNRDARGVSPPSSSSARAFARLVESAAGVRDVRPEQRFTRALAWDETADASADAGPSRRDPSSRRSRRFEAGGGSGGSGDAGRTRRARASTSDRAAKEGVVEDRSRRSATPALESRMRARKRRRHARASHGGGGGASPGRLRTRPTIGMEPEGFEADEFTESSDSSASRPVRGYHDGGAYENESDLSVNASRRALLRLSRAASPGVAESMGASFLWQKGFSGAGVRMGVFDTGVKADHPHFRVVKDRSNWTHEDTLSDGLGHGTFVAGVVASQDASCPGFAPDAEIHTFRVFTNDQVSYTSWFLDAFNYAIASEVHVINLSIGGPDYLDAPFVDKIDEIVANGIIMISAIGNDGPLWGTLNNPADQLDVIGVGGIDFKDQIAPFSSRGMSTHELPHGYGRVKPDVVAYGRDVMGSKISGGCRSLSGTSVASPVVAGAVTLLASTVPPEKRWDILNPASMKQALVEGAVRLTAAGDRSMYAQGAGKLNLVNAFEILRAYAPRASLVPGSLDFEHEASCPYAWPHCAQPLYHGAMPFMFNATIVNGMGLGGWLAEPPRFEPADPKDDPSDLGAHLDFRFDFSETLWPWSGFLAMYVRVKDSAKALTGTATGQIVFTVQSPPGRGETEIRSSRVSVPVRFSVAPTPPRARRVLWSQFHSVRYPPGYVPRDSLDVKADILDWHGDHPHTNFHAAYDAMRAAGYFVEILGSPLTCFDAREYGALLLVDSEEEFSRAEIEKLERDVRDEGLGVAVFAEWFNVKQMESMRFFDDNTHSHWTPVTGGGNVPALNELLAPFGVALGDRLLKGTAMLKSGEPIVYATGADIAAAPPHAHVHVAHLADHAKNAPGVYGDDGAENSPEVAAKAKTKTKPANAEFAVAAFLDETALGSASNRAGGSTGSAGRVAVFGDSNCLDSSHSASECFPLLLRMLRFLADKDDDTGLTPADGSKRSSAPHAPYGDSWRPPPRRSDVDFGALSTTLGGHPGNEGRLGCGANDPLAFQDEETRARVSYASSGWSSARAAATVETRPTNWRERMGAEAAAELAALGDVFAERRREVANAGKGGGETFVAGHADPMINPMNRVNPVNPESSFAKSDARDDGDDDVSYGNLVKKPARRAGGAPTRDGDGDEEKKAAGSLSVTGSFSSASHTLRGFAEALAATAPADRVGMAAAALFVCAAASRVRERRRARRTSKKSASAASRPGTSTPARRGRRLAP